MKSFEYSNGTYTATCGVWIGTFFKEALEDLVQTGRDSASACFNDITISVYVDSYIYDLYEKYDYKKEYLRLKAKYKE